MTAHLIVFRHTERTIERLSIKCKQALRVQLDSTAGLDVLTLKPAVETLMIRSTFYFRLHMDKSLLISLLVLTEVESMRLPW